MSTVHLIREGDRVRVITRSVASEIVSLTAIVRHVPATCWDHWVFEEAGWIHYAAIGSCVVSKEIPRSEEE